MFSGLFFVTTFCDPDFAGEVFNHEPSCVAADQGLHYDGFRQEVVALARGSTGSILEAGKMVCLGDFLSAHLYAHTYIHIHIYIYIYIHIYIYIYIVIIHCTWEWIRIERNYMPKIPKHSIEISRRHFNYFQKHRRETLSMVNTIHFRRFFGHCEEDIDLGGGVIPCVLSDPRCPCRSADASIAEGVWPKWGNQLESTIQMGIWHSFKVETSFWKRFWYVLCVFWMNTSPN